MSMTIQQAKELERLKQTNPSLWQKITSGIMALSPTAQVVKNVANSGYNRNSSFLPNLNRMIAGSDISDQTFNKHILGKNSGYNNQVIVNNAISDATDGYHIRSGKDYAEQATGNLRGGGIPAAIAGMIYQQMDGLGDSSLLDSFIDDPRTGKPRGTSNLSNIFGTFGPNAWLQGADNVEGLRQSGKAPALDALYNFGGGVHNLFNNPSSIDVTALGGPRAKGNIFNQGRIEVSPKSRPTVQPQGPAGFTQPTVQPVTQPVTQPALPPSTPLQPTAAPTVPTYNPPQGPAGFTRPTRSPAQQAATVSRKAKSMGVASPIRRTPGTKYGFGL